MKHWSVFTLYARMTLWRALGLLLLLTGGETVLFGSTLHRVIGERVPGSALPRLETLVEMAHLGLCFGAVFLLLTLLLSLAGTGYHSQVGYTLQRLAVSERTVFLWQAVYNALLYFLLAALQLGLIFLFGQWYLAAAPAETVSNQTLFLAFWRSDLLHALLPLEDILLWVRNLLLMAALGAVTALFAYRQRRKKFSGMTVALAVFTLFFFPSAFDNRLSIAVSIVAVLIAGATVAYGLSQTYLDESGEEEDAHESGTALRP